MTTTTTRPDIPSDVETPEHRIDREIYAMPAFVTLPVTDLDASMRWYAALGFVVLARMGAGPAQVVHLRRYRYQDILLVPADEESAATAATGTRARTSFSHMGPSSDLDEAAVVLADLDGSVVGPEVTPWHALELTATDADGHQVTLTARPDTPPPQGLVDAVRASVVEE